MLRKTDRKGEEMAPQTIFEKLWQKHIVSEEEGKPSLIYIDLHLIHEVTSPQAFEGLRLAGRNVRRPDLTFATMDHNVPTINRMTIEDKISKKQVDTLRENCEAFDVPLFDLKSPKQGIVHIIGPELGLTQPGKTIVCGDSHTSTHGAFGAFAFGIGTSEVEHVLSTQTLWQAKPKTLQVKVDGELGAGVTAKDVILSFIGKYGVNAGNGHVIEYTGDVIRNMSIEERMTVCNMSIEAGARAGIISPDEKTVAYLRDKENIPTGAAFDALAAEWLSYATDEGAVYDKTIEMNGADIEPQVTWGTNPSMTGSVHDSVPYPSDYPESEQSAIQHALDYMGLEAGTKMTDIRLDHVFLGSCTNARIGDLRKAAKVIKGRQVAPGIRAMVVPGSMGVKHQAEKEGLDEIFKASGFQWRDSGCSMCLGMNPDIVPEGERCASTSNRNFEGRQGKGAQTHLVSPEMAAAAAINGRFVDVREWDNDDVAESGV